MFVARRITRAGQEVKPDWLEGEISAGVETSDLRT